MKRTISIVLAVVFTAGLIVFTTATVDIALAKEVARPQSALFGMSTDSGALFVSMILLILSVFGLVSVYATFPEKQSG